MVNSKDKETIYSLKNVEVIRTEIAKLKLEKDDKLIVRIRQNEYFSDDIIENIGQTIKKLFPNHKVILIEGDIDIEILKAKGNLRKKGKKHV